MNRRRFIDSLIAAAAGFSLPARAGESPKVHRVGMLSLGTDPAQPTHWLPFVDAMRELGYIEGRNLALERAFAGGKLERLDSLVTELVHKRVDVIVTSGIRETRAAMRAAASIPVVMTVVPDPAAEGFVASLARPGGNVTGLTLLTTGQHQKYLELLTEIAPTAMRLAALASAPNPTAVVRQELEAAARARRVTLTIAQAQDKADIALTIPRLKKAGVTAIIVLNDPVMMANRHELAQALAKAQLPAIYAVREHVDAGGLMAYGPSLANLRRRAAGYVDRILKGTRPADLPVEQPTKFELVVNLKTATALGLAIPHSILVRADEVIE